MIAFAIDKNAVLHTLAPQFLRDFFGDYVLFGFFVSVYVAMYVAAGIVFWKLCCAPLTPEQERWFEGQRFREEMARKDRAIRYAGYAVRADSYAKAYKGTTMYSEAVEYQIRHGQRRY